MKILTLTRFPILQNKYVVIVIIVLLGFVIYFNSLGNEFVFDDFPNIVENNFIREWKNITGLFKKEYYEKFQEKTYRPITTLSYFIDYHIWKLNKYGWHLSNIFFHCINSIIVFYISRYIFKTSLVSLFVALIFVVLPVHTEAVNIASFRDDLISFLFVGGALLLYIKQRYLTSFVSFILSIFSKEMSITYPIIIAIYETTFGNWSKDKKKKTLFICSCLLSILFFLVITKLLLPPTGYVMGMRLPQHFHDWKFKFAIISLPFLIVYYLKLLLFPLNLSIYHTFQFHSSFLDIRIITCLIVIVILFLVTLFSKNKILIFSFFYFFITILPVSNLFLPIGALLAERYLYFPALGFCLYLGGLLKQILEKKKYLLNTSTLYGFIAIIFLFGARTVARNRDFKTPLTLWLKASLLNPDSSHIHSVIGKLFFKYGEMELAIKHNLKAIELNPKYFPPYFHLGVLFFSQGNFQIAEDYFKKVLYLEPLNYSSLLYLGEISRHFRKWDSAMNYYLLAFKIKSTFEICNNIGAIYLQLSKYQKAIEFFKKSIQIAPENTQAWYNLGLCYERMSLLEKAVEVFRKVITIDPNDTKAKNMISILVKKKSWEGNK